MARWSVLPMPVGQQELRQLGTTIGHAEVQLALGIVLCLARALGVLTHAPAGRLDGMTRGHHPPHLLHALAGIARSVRLNGAR
eukprot:12642115-Alexandrium_andersonii.AAC.1